MEAEVRVQGSESSERGVCVFILLHFLTDLTVSVSASINLPVFGRHSILCYEFFFP